MTATPLPKNVNHALRLADWPPVDALAWAQALKHANGPFRKYGGGRRRSSYTFEKYAQGYGMWLRYLKDMDELDPAAAAADRVTLERIDGYFVHLEERGNGDYTIVGRFEELRGALQLIAPERDFGFVTRPEGVSIRQMLDMSRRALFVPDSRHNELWAEELFREALTLSVPARRQILVRDAAIIGILAGRAPRARALMECRLGSHLKRTAEGWDLVQDTSVTKERNIVELPLSPRVSRILERYVTVERNELLGGRESDAPWITEKGEPLGRKGMEYMIALRSKQRYGVRFGPHRFRASQATTRAVVTGNRPLDSSLILGHGEQMTLKSYIRANNLAASRNHDASVTAVEDEARKLLGPDWDKPLHQEPDPAPVSIPRNRRKPPKPSKQPDLFD
jgi:hypothetical protein